VLDSAIPEVTPEAVLESTIAVDGVEEKVLFLLEKEGIVLFVCD
jgi:hypothetical protein